MNKTYLKNTAILFVSMTITKIVGAIFKIPLANILGGTGMGYFSTAYGLYSPVFALTAAGIPTVMMRITAQNIAANRAENAIKIRRTALLVFSVLGFAGTLTVTLLSAFFAEHIACSPESTPAIIAIAPAVMLCCIASVIRGYHEGLSNVVPSAFAAVTEAVSRAVFGLTMSYGIVFFAKFRFENGLAFLGKNFTDYNEAYTAALPFAAAGAITAVSLSELCGLISLLISDRKIRRQSFCDNTPTDRKRDIIKKLIKELLPIAASALVMNCVSFVDLLTVTCTLKSTTEENSAYFLRNFSDAINSCGGIAGLANFMYGSYSGIAMTMFMLIPSFAGMTEKTAIPEITAAWERKNIPNAANSCCTLFHAAATIGFPACLGAAALGEPLLLLLYKNRAAEVGVCSTGFVILCIGGMFMIIGSSMFGVFQAIGKAYIPLLLMSCAVAVKSILNPLLMSVPQINISGAAASTAISYIIMTITGSIILKKQLSSEISVLHCIKKPLICSALCGTAAYMVYHIPEYTLAEQPFSVIISIAAGVLVYGISLILTNDFSAKRQFIKKKEKKT